MSERSGTASASYDDSSDDNVASATALVVVIEQRIEPAKRVVLERFDGRCCVDGMRTWLARVGP
ncbi:MAG: hypothetical protein ACRDUV_24150 [Pseudonocardiaceae bacterium]